MLSDKIEVQYEDHYPQIEQNLNLQALQETWADLKLQTPVSFVFMSDDELLEVNKEALNHDYYTDVITFDYDDDDIEFNEVLISVDRITEHAEQLNIPLAHELHRVCIHGLLHLAGHDDQIEEDKNKMTNLENHYLKKIVPRENI